MIILQSVKIRQVSKLKNVSLKNTLLIFLSEVQDIILILYIVLSVMGDVFQ